MLVLWLARERGGVPRRASNAEVGFLLARIPRIPIAISHPDLLEDDDTLRAIRPPPTDEDRSVLGAEEIAALFAARAVHYGHEDVMHHQFTVRPPPPPPRSPGFVPWRGAKMEGAPSEVAQHAAALAAAEVEAANDVPRGGRLRTIVFSDGSSREVM